MAKIGYARVSTGQQSTDNQVERLRAAGCERVFTDDGVSGVKASRPEWDKALEYVRAGDTLVSVKLDRFGRSLKHLLEVSELLRAKGVDLQCLDQPINTTTPEGKLFFGILACFAEFERDLAAARTREALASTKARGRSGGPHFKLTDSQVQWVQAQHDAGVKMPELLVKLKELTGVEVTRYTIYRALDRNRQPAH